MYDKKRENFFIIDNDFVELYAKHLGVYCTAVYTSLNKHADNKTGRCWPSMETIAQQHHIERHTVSRALVELEKWNIIKTERAIDRKNKKRKNNVYTLLKKELWRALPTEGTEEATSGTISSTESHGSENTFPVVSEVPQDGAENSSNKTHIIKLIEENTNCGQESTTSIIPNQSSISKEDQKKAPMVGELEPVTWNYKQEVSKLINSDYLEYRVIGCYFSFKNWSFENKLIFEMGFNRNLKPANLLKVYKIQDIKNTMKWCEEAYGPTVGWTLETVIKKIDDCIATNFVSQEQKKRVAEMKANGSLYVPGKYKDVKVTTIKNVIKGPINH